MVTHGSSALCKWADLAKELSHVQSDLGGKRAQDSETIRVLVIPTMPDTQNSTSGSQKFADASHLKYYRFEA